MRKNTIRTLAVVIIFCICTCHAQADVIHIEQQITDLVSIDADFSLHEVGTASVIRLERVNLIDEAFTEKMVEILFHLDGDVSHTYFHNGNNLVTHNGALYEDGETIYTFDAGMFGYRDEELFTRYHEVVCYISNGLEFPWSFDENLVYTENDLMDDHEGFSRDEALETAIKALQAIYEEFGSPKPQLISQYALSYEDCAAITKVLSKRADVQQYYSNPEQFHKSGLNPIAINDWSSKDDLYVFEFGLELNGIPEMTKTNILPTTDAEYFPDLTSRVYMNRGSSIYEMHTYVYRTVAEEEAQKILSTDALIEAIGAYFDSVISMEELILTEAALEYLPIVSASEMKLIECIPVWRVTADLIVGECVYKDYRSFCFNAITGEVVR